MLGFATHLENSFKFVNLELPEFYVTPGIFGIINRFMLVLTLTAVSHTSYFMLQRNER